MSKNIRSKRNDADLLVKIERAMREISDYRKSAGMDFPSASIGEIARRSGYSRPTPRFRALVDEMVASRSLVRVAYRGKGCIPVVYEYYLPENSPLNAQGRLF